MQVEPTYFFAVAEAIALEPDFRADLLTSFQLVFGHVVEILEAVHVEELPLYEKLPFTVIVQMILPELSL